MNLPRCRVLLFILLASVCPQAISQTEPPFHTLMEIAKIKKLIQVDTVAGRTNALLTSIGDNPGFVFILAPGGDGNLEIGAGEDGLPRTKRVRNLAYFFACFFGPSAGAFAIQLETGTGKRSHHVHHSQG